ncbi:hypothetical protein BX600DRAFT_443914 [Xylariales sp. PMI_506]|nr:hypothetical protein BX600DRAFT_443914 [Xylariales sp. PMI_506]
MPRRSRGCLECRKRRIGCDLAAPSCRQCLITGRTCSGASQGATIIDQTRAVMNKYNTDPESSSSSSPSSSTAKESNESCGNFTLCQQPSHRAIMFSSFVSHFMSFLTSNTGGQSKWPWLHAVQDITAPMYDGDGDTLQLSLHALATAYCGTTSRNTVAIAEALRMYGIAVGQLRAALLVRTSAQQPPDSAMICTTVLLSLFESVCATSPGAYAAHLAAARKMLGLARAEMAGSTFLRQVGVHIQYQTLLTKVTGVSLGSLSAENSDADSDWNDLCWFQLNESPQVADRLLWQLLRLGEVFSEQRHRRYNVKRVAYLDDITYNIDNLWVEYLVEELTHDNDIFQLSCDTEKTPNYRDVMTALTIAYFATARILLSVLQDNLAASPSLNREGTNVPGLEHQYEVILTSCSYLATQDIGCASFRLIFPLTLAAVYSTSSVQRWQAKELLENWLQIYAFTGMYVIVDWQGTKARGLIHATSEPTPLLGSSAQYVSII